MRQFSYIAVGVGILIIAIAVLDIMNVPLEIPTSNNYANIGIGGALIAFPFVLKQV